MRLISHIQAVFLLELPEVRGSEESEGVDERLIQAKQELNGHSLPTTEAGQAQVAKQRHSSQLLRWLS